MIMFFFSSAVISPNGFSVFMFLFLSAGEGDMTSVPSVVLSDYIKKQDGMQGERIHLPSLGERTQTFIKQDIKISFFFSSNQAKSSGISSFFDLKKAFMSSSPYG